MAVQCITPILNVSNIQDSIGWFEKWGWIKRWEWGDPTGFACVGNGQCELFLCRDGQGGRGRGTNTSTFGPDGNESLDLGVWMSVFVDDVDGTFQSAQAAGVEVVFGPKDMPWGVRECHFRHPDGHVFRVGTSVTSAASDA